MLLKDQKNQVSLKLIERYDGENTSGVELLFQSQNPFIRAEMQSYVPDFQLEAFENALKSSTPKDTLELASDDARCWFFIKQRDATGHYLAEMHIWDEAYDHGNCVKIVVNLETEDLKNVKIQFKKLLKGQEK